MRRCRRFASISDHTGRASRRIARTTVIFKGSSTDEFTLLGMAGDDGVGMAGALFEGRLLKVEP
jgi:hypothetical protein